MSSINAGIIIDTWNGVFALRGGYDFNESWGLRGYFDIGSGDSDLTWMANIDFLYRVSDRTALVLGYRFLQFDADEGANELQLEFSGPYLGVGFAF